MHPQSITQSLAALALLLGATACYVERPLTTPVPQPATRIVALITDTGSVALANKIGPGAREMEGVVVSADAAAWDVQVIRVDYLGGTSQLWNRERVTFPRYALTNATERAFNSKKSWIIALTITGTAVLAARLFGVLGFGGGPNGEPPPPN
jgi:hypothetical protein